MHIGIAFTNFILFYFVISIEEVHLCYNYYNTLRQTFEPAYSIGREPEEDHTTIVCDHQHRLGSEVRRISYLSLGLGAIQSLVELMPRVDALNLHGRRAGVPGYCIPLRLSGFQRGLEW